MITYRNELAKKAGLTISSSQMVLQDLWDDIEFYDIQASDPRSLLEYWNELCLKDCPKGVRCTPIEIEVLIHEMLFNTEWQLYFANMQWKIAQGVA